MKDGVIQAHWLESAELPFPFSRSGEGPGVRVSPSEAMPMTPAQLPLARCALGLPNQERLSCRNAAFARGAEPDEWRAMVEAGEARPGKHAGWFHLTRAGAEAALAPGETLNPEDFP
jgi:hypothetical protein